MCDVMKCKSPELQVTARCLQQHSDAGHSSPVTTPREAAGLSVASGAGEFLSKQSAAENNLCPLQL